MWHGRSGFGDYKVQIHNSSDFKDFFFLLIIDSLTHVKQKKPIDTIQLFRMYSNSKAFESSRQSHLPVLKYN